VTDTAARRDGKNMKLKESCPTPYLSISELPRRQLTLEIIPVMFSKSQIQACKRRKNVGCRTTC
jgi:hypothetical protein